jgi:hypothetical protein
LNSLNSLYEKAKLAKEQVKALNGLKKDKKMLIKVGGADECPHGIEDGQNTCVFCSGEWESGLQEIVLSLGKQQWELELAESEVSPYTKREFEHVVPSEWEYLMISTTKIEPENLKTWQ